MTKIARFTGNLTAFASTATGTERTVFGDTAQSDTIDDNVNSDFLLGWEIVTANDAPALQDFNGLGLRCLKCWLTFIRWELLNGELSRSIILDRR